MHFQFLLWKSANLDSVKIAQIVQNTKSILYIFLSPLTDYSLSLSHTIYFYLITHDITYIGIGMV